MIVSPPGQHPTHGNCPALTSDWGQEYFARLRSLFEQTGFDLLEHDGSYPGDVDVTPRPASAEGNQGLPLGTVADHFGLLQVDAGPRRLPECSRLLLPGRLQQVRHGLPRDQLVAPARTAADSHSAEHLRRQLDQDAEHGLDVRAADHVSRRRCGGHDRTARRAPGPLPSG